MFPCPEPDCDRELKTVAAVAAHRRFKHGITADGTRVPDAELDDVERAPAEPDDGEVAPTKPGLVQRLRSRRGRGRGGQQLAPVPGERAPKRKRIAGGRRVPLDSDITDIWAFAGRRLEATPHFATGRMLEYQAPAAGIIIDRAVAGTLPDRIFFQPLARNRDKYEDVAFLLAGPLLTFSITSTMLQMQAALERNDTDDYEQLAAKLQMQREMFEWVARAMLPRLAAGAKLAREKKEKADKAISEAFPELGDTDPVDALAQMLFTPPTYSAPEGVNENGRADHVPTAPSGEGEFSY
jgi:hypothetical protein